MSVAEAMVPLPLGPMLYIRIKFAPQHASHHEHSKGPRQNLPNTCAPPAASVPDPRSRSRIESITSMLFRRASHSPSHPSLIGSCKLSGMSGSVSAHAASGSACRHQLESSVGRSPSTQPKISAVSFYSPSAPGIAGPTASESPRPFQHRVPADRTMGRTHKRGGVTTSSLWFVLD